MATVSQALNTINHLTVSPYGTEGQEWADFLKTVTTCSDIPPHSKDPYHHPTENWTKTDWALYHTMGHHVNNKVKNTPHNLDFIFKAHNVVPPTTNDNLEKVFQAYSSLPLEELEGIGY